MWPATATAADTIDTHAGTVYARMDATQLVIGNELIERRWTRDGFATVSFTDKRGGGKQWVTKRRDFSLRIGASPVEVGSDTFRVAGATATSLPRGGLRVVLNLEPRVGTVPMLLALKATRTIEAYPRVAGVRSQTVLKPTAPLVLNGYTLDELAVAGAAPRADAFNSGADFRGPGEENPPLSVGDPRAGEWRTTHTAAAGKALASHGEWLSLAVGQRTAFMVAERNDLPSSRADYKAQVGSVGVDFARDVISLGPFEENGHVENIAGSVGRAAARPPRRSLRAGAVLHGPR